MNYKISIILPIYNVEKYLSEALDSLLRQTIGIENLEIIMVNDCSTDKSPEIIDEYVDKYTNFKSIHLEKNSGFPGTPRNIGIEHAKGDYLMFFDPDDYYVKDALEILYNKITEEEVDIVASRFIYLFETHHRKSPDALGGLEEIKIKSIDEEPRIFNIGPTTWTKIYKREFITKNNLKFPENMLAEDLAFDVETLLEANGIVHLNNYFSYYYRKISQRDNKSFTLTRNKKTLLNNLRGYYETYGILKNHNKEEYFPLIFKGHLQYWMKQFVLSDTTEQEKLNISKEAAALFKISSSKSIQLDDIYLPLFEKISQERFEEIISDVKSLKYHFKIQEDYESNINTLNMLNKALEKKIKKYNGLLNKRKKQVDELQTTSGWLKYKRKNILYRMEKKIKK